jgi:hypothetical protein
MSLLDSLKSGFKNVGHYFASGFKAVTVGLEDVLKIAGKAQMLEPEVDAVVTALAGPAAGKISDLAFHLLGDAAAAITPVASDAEQQLIAKGLNLPLDAQFIADIKAAAAQIEQILKAIGAQKPAV